MAKKQVLQKTKLANRVVSRSRCLCALQSRDANANVRRINHVHVVSTITDGEATTVWVSFSHHFDDLCLLLWTHTAGKNCIRLLTQIQEVF